MTAGETISVYYCVYDQWVNEPRPLTRIIQLKKGIRIKAPQLPKSTKTGPRMY